ncbi:MAG: DUF1624 domain-containing protein [candidate division Zixibacteria bacterium]|nr:DUF1624 domain-containing protein [candidate division Zixibacteria bacterium]
MTTGLKTISAPVIPKDVPKKDLPKKDVPKEDIPKQIIERKVPRISAVDIGRGIAMVLVILVHTTWSLVKDPSGNLSRSDIPIVWLSQLATPAFLLISGMMLGYLFYSSDKSRFQRLELKLIKRALILLTFIHIFMNSGWAIYNSKPIMILTVFGITDVIGITLLIYLYFIKRISIKLYPAVIAFIAAWFFARSWFPDGYTMMIIKQLFLGPSADQPLHLHSSFALIPLTCIFHIGVVFGKKLSVAVMRGQLNNVKRMFLKAGIMMIIAAILLHQAGKFLFPKLILLGKDWENALYLFQKYPPSISYVLFYGGFSILLINFLLWYGKKFNGYGLWGRIFRVFGRTSLFTFAIQMHITMTIPYLLGFSSSLNRTEWFASFIVSLSIIWFCSFLWMKYYMKIPFKSPQPD